MLFTGFEPAILRIGAATVPHIRLEACSQLGTSSPTVLGRTHNRNDTLKMVPPSGLEPERAQCSRDFKSPVSTNSTIAVKNGGE